jgi:chromosome segregation ATPase
MPLASVLQAVDTHLETQEANGPDIPRAPRRHDIAVREGCANIIDKLSGLAALSDDLAAYLNQYDLIVKNLEATRAQLDQTACELRAERDAHILTQTSLAMLEGDRLTQTGVIQEELARTIAAGEEFASELQAARILIQQLQASAETDAARFADLTIELQTTNENLLKAEIAAAALRTELSSSLSRAADAEATNSALQAALADSLHGSQLLSASLNEVQRELEEGQVKIAQLVEQQAAETEAHREVTAILQSEVADQRAEIAALQVQMAAMTVRLEAADRLLADVPALVERAGFWERKVAALEAENAEYRAQTVEFEELQLAVAERAHTLVNAIKSKEKETNQTKARLISVSERLDNETNRFNEDRAQLEAKIAELTDQLAAARLAQPVAPDEVGNGASEIASDAGLKRHRDRIVTQIAERARGEASEAAPRQPIREENPKTKTGNGRKRGRRYRDINRQVSQH